MEFKYYRDYKLNKGVLISEEGAILLIRLGGYGEVTSYNELPNYYLGKHKFKRYIEQNATLIHTINNPSGRTTLEEVGDHSIVLAENGDIYIEYNDNMDMMFIYCNDLYMRVDRITPEDTDVNDKPRLTTIHKLDDKDSFYTAEIRTSDKESIRVSLGYDKFTNRTINNPSGINNLLSATLLYTARENDKTILIAPITECAGDKTYGVDYMGNIWLCSNIKDYGLDVNLDMKLIDGKYKSNYSYKPIEKDTIIKDLYHATIFSLADKSYKIFTIPSKPNQYFRVILNEDLDIEIEEIGDITPKSMSNDAKNFKRLIRSYPVELQQLALFGNNKCRVRVFISRSGELYKMMSGDFGDKDISKYKTSSGVYISKEYAIDEHGEFKRVQSPIEGKTPDNIDLLADIHGNIIGARVNNGAHCGIVPTSSGYIIINEKSYNKIGVYGRRWLDSLIYGNYKIVKRRAFITQIYRKQVEVILCGERTYSKDEDIFERTEQVYYNLADNKFYLRTIINGYKTWSELEPAYNTDSIIKLTKKLNL